MLPQIKIVTPSARTPFPGGRRFYATGFAPAGVEARHFHAVLFDLSTLSRMSGQWTWVISTVKTPWPNGGEMQIKWAGLYSADLPVGQYALLITAISERSLLFSLPRAFKVREQQAIKLQTALFINITSHANNDNITDQAELFVASGNLGDAHLAGPVTMNTLAGDVVNMSDANPPGWVAFFEPLLGPMNYRLFAEDSGPHDDVRNPLIVD